MGCDSSKPQQQDGIPGAAGLQTTPGQSSQIQKDLERAHKEEQAKIKMLLLGAGESGKSTIFKQMRILYGAPRDDSDMKMIGVVVRSNITTAIRKLCMLLRNLEVLEELEKESERLRQRILTL